MNIQHPFLRKYRLSKYHYILTDEIVPVHVNAIQREFVFVHDGRVLDRVLFVAEIVVYLFDGHFCGFIEMEEPAEDGDEGLEVEGAFGVEEHVHGPEVSAVEVEE